MAPRPDVPTADDRVVWERPEPASRPAPSPLSRERIVRAAIAIADQDGLEAVSLRRVGAALDAGPMRLYGYLSTKEELLELMVDALYGDMAVDGAAGADWREALRAVAYGIQRAARAHPWFVALLGGRPHLGPNALAYQEAAFAALSRTPGFAEIDVALQALRTVTAYAIGAIQREASELRVVRETGLDTAAWQTATSPYLERMFATGRFPHLARVVRDAAHLLPDAIFDQGLDWVLGGIAARLPG